MCFSSPHHSARKVNSRLDEQREICQTKWKFNETMMVWFKSGTYSRRNGKTKWNLVVLRCFSLKT